MALSPASSRPGSSSAVASVTAGDTSIVVGGTATNPTIETGSLYEIAQNHPTDGAWNNNNHGITNVSPGTTAGDVATFDQLPQAPAWSAALGLQAVSYGPNAPDGTFNPGGGELVRLVLLETMPRGVITGGAIALNSLGVSPSGTAQLGLVTFSGTDVAKYVAVTADISAALTAGALGIRRFDFTAPYTADGATPLWLAIAFTAGWGADITVAGFSGEAALGQPNAGHYRPRYAAIVAGAGTLAVNGTRSVWASSTANLFFGGVY